MSQLSPDQWRSLSPYLDEALTLSGEAQIAWMEALRARDPQLANQLEALLEEHRAVKQEGFLQKVPMLSSETLHFTGQALGAYKLISPIGQGGMGVVWLAERSDGRFERRVAVKVLNVALVGREGEERFKREGAILGRLSHAHIAKLLDAGVTETGHPYLVLEHVEGEPIDRYCDQRKLDVKARVRLFLDVLDAVAHAHANLIVHRDIKPSNVFVSKDGEVKLLDFGIAKLLEAEGQEKAATLLTREGGSPLTPEYAAPEQVTGGPITTATDVYGLGLLFYLLLSGQHPAGTGIRSPAALFKAIVEIETPRLSATANSIAADARSNVAANRGTTPDKLGRILRGDLDTIATKALKKNPDERYSSVAAFADDLSRYLKQEPISARPDTLAYRTAKFVRRNRTAVALATLAGIAIVAGLAGTLVQTRTAQRQRDVAFRERDRANRITGFMTDMFKVSDPSQSRGESIKAREILDKAAQRIETGLAKDPETQAHMMYVIGEVYDNLGLISEARALVERAAELQRRVLGQENPETLASMNLMGKTLTEQGHFAEAENLHRRTLELRRQVLGPEHPDTLHSMSRLAAVLGWENKNSEAEKLAREAVEIERRVLGPEHPETLRLTNNLVSILWSEGDEKLYEEAERIQREALDIEQRVLGPEDPDTLNGLNSLGVILRRRGQYGEAEKVYRETLRIQSRVLGPQHPDTLVLRHNLATALAKQAHYAEAEQMYLENRAIQERIFGPDHPYTANSTYNLACLAAVQGRRDRALSLLDQALKHGLTARVALSMEKDEDLTSLRGDPRFVALIARTKKRDAGSQKAN
jgi:serine/threonine protein kinase/tetratricopeptide (TPR) repeat protein